MDISDAYPSKDLPDIFRGSQLAVLGRYAASGKVKVQLSGIANGKRRTFTLKTHRCPKPTRPRILRAAAMGRAQDRLPTRRDPPALQQELIDEVVRLSKEYGIPTEYTSFLADDRNLTANLEPASYEPRWPPSRQTARPADQRQLGRGAEPNASAARETTRRSPPPRHRRWLMATEARSWSGRSQQTAASGGVYQNAQDQTVVVANVQNVAQRTFYQRGQVLGGRRRQAQAAVRADQAVLRRPLRAAARGIPSSRNTRPSATSGWCSRTTTQSRSARRARTS